MRFFLFQIFDLPRRWKEKETDAIWALLLVFALCKWPCILYHYLVWSLKYFTEHIQMLSHVNMYTHQKCSTKSKCKMMEKKIYHVGLIHGFTSTIQRLWCSPSNNKIFSKLPVNSMKHIKTRKKNRRNLALDPSF